MKIITKTTVELTEAEQTISRFFESLLDHGYSIPEALASLRSEGYVIQPALEAWLSGAPLPA